MTETKIKEESSNEGVATEMAQKKTDGLLKKLVEITAKVERIPKNGWNDRQKYYYALESDIKDVVRKEMSERGLVLVPSELNRVVSVINTKSGGQQQIVSLEIEYTIYDAETGEKITFRG
ncbi:ERF family protein, partial [Guyparkeria sp. 1SP6A2]|nr:ERF family protein [Guyparkeria sp. 1SP6A2]